MRSICSPLRSNREDEASQNRGVSELSPQLSIAERVNKNGLENGNWNSIMKAAFCEVWELQSSAFPIPLSQCLLASYTWLH